MSQGLGHCLFKMNTQKYKFEYRSVFKFRYHRTQNNFKNLSNSLEIQVPSN